MSRSPTIGSLSSVIGSPGAFGLFAGVVALLACAVPASGSTLAAEPLASATGAARAVPDSARTDTIEAYTRGRRYTQRLATKAGEEVAVVSENVYREPGVVEYYRVSRFAATPDTTWTTRWAWAWASGDTIVALSLTITPAPAPSAYSGYHTKTNLHLPFVTPPGMLWSVRGQYVQPFR